MTLLDFQSPFSILGLKYSDNTTEAIKSAYRASFLRCHPDKAPGTNIPANYVNLIQDAYHQLLEGGSQLDRFKGYPVVFYPKKDDSRKPIFRIPESPTFAVCECGEILPEQSAPCITSGCQQFTWKTFEMCNACRVPIPKEGFERHLSQHTDICRVCNEVMDKDHNALRHPDKICPLCPALNEENHHLSHVLDECVTCDQLGLDGTPTQLVSHIRNDHFHCPLCGKECGDLYRSHFFKVHSFDLRKCCGKNAGHYQAHQWLQCPYPKCGLDVAKGKLWEHMASSHKFERCSDCSRSEDGFIGDQTHIKAHAFEDCPECATAFRITNLPHHLVSDHLWLLCLYCERAERSEDELDDHIKEDHRLIVCSICKQEHLEEKTDLHHLDLHNWLRCSWCNEAFAEDELRTHIAVSHPPQEFCDCGYKETVLGLKIHKIQSHAWQKCPYCENIEPPDRIDQHINSHQPTTCQECNIGLLPEQETVHYQQTHQYLQCSFCDYSDSQSKMLTHMQSHLSQSQLQPNPELFIPSAKFQDIPVPFQGKDGPAKSYNMIRCGNCRTRKKRCTFADTNSVCVQCEDRGVTCPGPSERKRPKVGASSG